MNKIFKKCVFASLTAAMVAGVAASCDDDDDDNNNVEEDTEIKYYATTDMTWAEFYAGELGQSSSALESEGYDAVTSATKSKAFRFPIYTSEDSIQIIGPKAVSVGMTETVYNNLTDEQKKRFTFVSDTVFASYKTLKSDGSFSASNATTDTQSGITATLSCGANAVWANYIVDLSSLEGVDAANLQGAILTTTNGKQYGLKPLDNLWLKTTEFAFCVAEFTNPHATPGYKSTADLEGKKLKNITYLLKGLNKVSVDLGGLYVKKQTTATATAGSVSAGSNQKVNITFSGVPSGESYAIAMVKKGSGRAAVTLTEDQYSFADGVLTINTEIASGDSYTVYFDNDNYASISATFTVE